MEDPSLTSISMADIVSELKKRGYEIEQVTSTGSDITGITLDNSSISISKNGSATITVSFNGNSDGMQYYAVVNGEKYLMSQNQNSGIKISKEASKIDGDTGTTRTLSAVVSSGSSVTIGTISENTITINAGSTVGSSTITVSYGSYTATCSASVVVTPTDSSVADASTTFSTEYGKIDVIWLSGTGNTISTTPNAPKLSGMTPVSWTKSGDEWSEDTTASASYYSYTAGSGSEDNTSSRWANAKNSDGSYFVWIPRYAYRITYYSSQTSTEPTGYYDGWGQWRASDGKVRLELDSGIETVEYGGNKYIVHPAFCGSSVGYDNGSWDSAISGFWVAKYEMSRTGATASSAGSGYSTKFLSIPNVQSARSITIGNMYNVAKSYDSSKDSHLMKNSEWGAVAYLTQSQYGRNGNEIDINNSSSYITGNGGGSTSASSASGTTNAYNTTLGAKASTTGNVYGVYDMSGGAWEYVAVFNNTDTNNYESSYGSSFASTSGSSDKYATKYYNENTSSSGNARIYTYGKIGDATKEVNKGGEYDLTNTSTYYNWFGDYPYLCDASYPFVVRGGNCGSGAYAGVFSSGYFSGGSYRGSFRTVLCP